MSGRARAVATGDTLPRRLSDTMQQRLDQLSNAASQVVQVAAVLPDQFSARCSPRCWSADRPPWYRR